MSFLPYLVRLISSSHRHPRKQKPNVPNSPAGGRRVLHPSIPPFPFTSTTNSTAQVYAAGSEDMDTLTFSAPVLFRHLTFSEAKKQPISEINLQAALDGLGMRMTEVSEVCSYFCSAIFLLPLLSLIPYLLISSLQLHQPTIITTNPSHSLPVRRPLPPPRLRLPRANQGRRTQIRAQAHKGTRRLERRRSPFTRKVSFNPEL